MSKYTTEVRFICETSAGLTESAPFTDVNSILETAAPLVFNFDWPIFDETYRLPLEIKILRHFYTREICEETVGLWKLRLQDRLNMLMPYYNQLYRSALLEFNPFYDVDYEREHTGQTVGNESTNESGKTVSTEIGVNDSKVTTNKNSNSTTDSESESKNEVNGERNASKMTNDTGSATENDLHWDLYSDTPQGGIDGIQGDYDSVVRNTYLTNARKVTDDKSSTYRSNNLENSQDASKEDSTLSSKASTIDFNTEQNEENRVTENNVTGTVNNDKTGKRDINNFEQYAEHVVGKQGTLSYSKMLQEFRDTFLNIDKMIIDNLNDLFFGLW